MYRLAIIAVGLAIIAAAPTYAASPSEQMSRYERDVHQAQKRLHKHRMEKAKKLLKRQRAKAKRLIKQQRREREQQQRSTGT